MIIVRMIDGIRKSSVFIGGVDPLVSLPSYALAQDLNKRSLTEKIRPVMPILSSHAGIIPVTEKKP